MQMKRDFEKRAAICELLFHFLKKEKRKKKKQVYPLVYKTRLKGQFHKLLINIFIIKRGSFSTSIINFSVSKLSFSVLSVIVSAQRSR